MARAKAVSSREVVLAVLRVFADAALERGDHVIVFTKAEFIKTYWRLRRKRLVPFVKMETLLRTLRKLAAESNLLKYENWYGGRYVLDVVTMP